MKAFNRETAIQQIEAGRCPCDRCPGQLTDPAKSKGGWAFCAICGCAWQATLVNATTYASTIIARSRPRRPNRKWAPTRGACIFALGLQRL